MTLKSTKWLRLFEQFIADIRIQSKEELSPDGRGAPLKLWESQRRYLREVGNGLDNGIHSFNCLKSRQLGATTVSLAIDVFWLAMHPGIRGCVVTDDEKKRDENRGLIVSYVDSFPSGYFGEHFAIRRGGNSRTRLEFTNGSRLAFLVAGTRDKGTSWAEGSGYALLHATELANYGSPEGFKSLEEGLAQSNPHRLFMRESTAKGYNHWHTRWTAGLNDLTERSFFVGWWSCELNRIERKDPRYIEFGLHSPTSEERELMELVRIQYQWKITPEQIAWIRWKQAKAGNEQGLLEENQPWLPSQAFQLTGYSFFPVRQVSKELEKLVGDPPVFSGYRYENSGDFFSFRMIALDPDVDDASSVELKVWEEPVEGGKYVIGFDPAYGRSPDGDGNAIVVLRCYADRVVQVAEYRTREVDIKYASWVCFHLGSAYRDAMVNVEINGCGALVMSEFDHLRQLLASELRGQQVRDRGWEDAGAQVRWFLYHRADSFGSGYQANYMASFRTRQIMLYGMRGEYDAGHLVIRSGAMLLEMRNMVVVDDRIGAPDNPDDDKKDDRVFALGLAILCWTNWLRAEMIQSGLTYEFVTEQERVDRRPDEKRVNSLVARFMARAGEEPEPEADWRESFGL
jgi:hypothetical protein